MEVNTISCCDVLEGLKGLPDKSVNCVITSPPYWQLRDYGWDGQWGLEPTFYRYLEHLWQMMDEVYRVLKDDGTVWVNLGDTYGGSKTTNTDNKHKGNVGTGIDKEDGINKCLTLIPHRFAIGCLERDWLLRNDIIWAKRNAMPESVTDRFSKKHEFIFFMVKNEDYYFDLDSIRDKQSAASIQRYQYEFSGNPEGLSRVNSGRPQGKKHTSPKSNSYGQTSKNVLYDNPDGKNPGDVSDFWDITTKGSSDEHYAAYNAELIDKPIVAGCPKDGIILDPFCGTATTGLRAIELGRKFIGFDGSEKYVNAANKKLKYLLSQTVLF